MSIKLMSLVWDIDDDEVKDARLLTLLSLADHANDEGQCGPSIPRLAKRARVSERQVQRVLQWLIDAGYVKVIEKGNGRGNVTNYQITLKGDVVTPIKPVKGVKKSPNKPSIKGDIGDIKGDIQNVKGDIGDEIYSHARREPSIEPSIESSLVLSPTPQQEMFGAVCEAIGTDPNTLTKEDKGQIAQAVGILTKANYTVDDIRRFITEHWYRDWRWEKNGKPPTLKILRNEIGIVRSVMANMAPPVRSTNNGVNAIMDYMEMKGMRK
jgi:predicted transcriptional regulator